MARGFPYAHHPTGWFQVAWSGEVKPGEVRPLRFCGQDLVMYRGESGGLHLFDAHCKHNGAHLGYGGKVWGDDIVCPFHAWRWDCDGNNVDIPYSRILHNKAKLRKWHVLERSGIAWAWHDAEGVEPYWEPLELPEDGVRHYPIYEYSTHIKSQPWYPQYFTENLADAAHVKYVHKSPTIAVDLAYSWDGPNWTNLMDYEYSKGYSAISGAQKGQGVSTGQGVSAVRTTYDHSEMVNVVTLTPVDECLTDFRMTSYLPRTADSPDAPNAETLKALDKRNRNLLLDFELFDHALYLDGPVWPPEESRKWNELRRWLRQFYPADTGIRHIPAGQGEPPVFDRQEDSIVGGRRTRDAVPVRVTHAD